jgi:hypothetical protein
VDMNRLIYSFFWRKIFNPPCFTNILLSECVGLHFPFLAVVAYHSTPKCNISKN